jgi:hypothetical protein
MFKQSDKPLRYVVNAHAAKSAITKDADRRRDDRYPFTAAAEVIEASSDMRVAGRVSDLGSGGCYVDTILPFAVGTTVCVRLRHGQRRFEATAKVSYAHSALGMGLTFTEIRPEDLTVLKIWLAELTGEPQPPSQVGANKKDATVAAFEAEEAGNQLDNSKLRQFLNELVNLMIRKKIIDEDEGATLIRQLFR